MLQHIFRKLHLNVIVYVKINWLRVCILSAIFQYGGRLKIPSGNLHFYVVCVLNKQFYDIFMYRAFLIYQTVFSQFQTKVLSSMNWNGCGTFSVGAIRELSISIKTPFYNLFACFKNSLSSLFFIFTFSHKTNVLSS